MPGLEGVGAAQLLRLLPIDNVGLVLPCDYVFWDIWFLDEMS